MSQLNKVKLLITEDGHKVLSVDGHIINKVRQIDASYDLIPGKTSGDAHRVTIMLDAEFVIEDQRGTKIDPAEAKRMIIKAYTDGSIISVRDRYPLPENEHDRWEIHRTSNPSTFDFDVCIYTWNRKGKPPLEV